MLNYKNIAKTNVQAVDLCMNEIYWCRRNRKPLKAIYLWPEMFGQFKKWVADSKKWEIGGYERTLERTGLKEHHRLKLQQQLEVLKGQLLTLDEIQIEMDGVTIAQGQKTQPKPLLCELWESNLRVTK